MDGIIADRIALIRAFIDEHGPDYLWVPVSGGKDSAAAWGLVARATVDYVAVYIMIPGQTHSDNARSVEAQAAALGVRDTVTVRVNKTRQIRERLKSAVEACSMPCLLRILAFDTHGRNYWGAMRQYGFPAPLGRFGRGTRWCCGTFKHRVLQRLPYNGARSGVPWKYGVNGVKATDSPYRRKRYTSIVQTWEKTRDTYLFPLLDLADAQVWAILGRLGLLQAVLPQYERWGRSPNCMWCPLLGRRSAERTARAMPEGARRLVREVLQELRGRYREGTYSRKMIEMWLSLLQPAEGDDYGEAGAPSSVGKPVEDDLHALTGGELA